MDPAILFNVSFHIFNGTAWNICLYQTCSKYLSWRENRSHCLKISVQKSAVLAFNVPMICTAPYVMLLIRANPVRRQVGGGLALEIQTFWALLNVIEPLGECHWGLKMIFRNRFQEINSARYSLLAGRYHNPIPTRFLAPIDCSIDCTQCWSLGTIYWG